MSCGTYVKAYDAFRSKDGKVSSVLDWPDIARYRQFEEWINGYVFGLETRVFKSQPLRPWDRNGMQVWINNYCEKHPLENVANAALAFFKTLGGRIDVRPDDID